MDIGSVASTASAMTAAQTRVAVELSVLKKAIDLESAGALALVQAIPTAPAPSARAVDTWA